MDNQTVIRPKFTIPAIIAIICAVASFATGAFWGFILAMIAVAFGALGFLLSLSATRRGGMVSMLAILGGVLGVIAAIVKAIAWAAS
jgi:hypothetical protein